MASQDSRPQSDSPVVPQNSLFRDLWRTITDPARAAEAGRPGLKASILLLGVNVLLFALSLQFLYPRMLDQMPFLGGLRRATKLITFSSNAVFDLELFLRWFAGALLVVACWFLGCLIVGWLSGDRALRNPAAALQSAAACAVPFFVATLLALPGFYAQYAASLLPVAALIFCGSIYHHAQTGRYHLSPAIAIYTTPVVWLAQIGCLVAIMP
jgi:hypothetical protein